MLLGRFVLLLSRGVMCMLYVYYIYVDVYR